MNFARASLACRDAHHRLKPGGVPTVFTCFVVVKLKYHRLKPGGVPTVFTCFVVVKLKYHRLKPGGVPTVFTCFVVVKLQYHRLKPGGVSHDKTDAYRTSSVAEVFTPSFINQCLNVITDNKFIGKSGLGARIDHNWRFINEVMTLNGCLCSVDIRCRFETSPR